MIGFVFCGMDSYADLSLIVNDIHRPIAPTISENVQSPPGMVGNIFQGNSYGSKQFDIDVTLLASSEEDRAQKIHDLADLFIQTGSGEFPMVFTDESEYTYYGHFTALPALTRLSQTDCNASGTLSFVCSDPAAYGVQVSKQLSDNPHTETPDGTTDEYPILTCVPNSDVTKIGVTDADGNYVYIGAEVDPDSGSSPVDNMPRVVSDACNSFGTGWSTVPTSPSFSIENGVISSGATMQSHEDMFTITNYNTFGSNVSGKWHGAGIQKMFPASYPDWKIRCRLFNTQHYPRARGKIEVYLLDANGKRIGRLYLKDSGNGEDAWCLAEIGGTSSGANHKTLYWGQGSVHRGRTKTIKIKTKNGTKTVKVSKSKSKTVQQYKTFSLSEDLTTDTFTNFYGYIEIQKIGNKFRCEIMKYDQNAKPVWNAPIVQTFTDTQGVFSSALAGCALYIAKYDITEDTTNPVTSYENNHMGLTDVKVWNILNGGVNESTNPEVIARKGDEIKINCEDRTIYRNGAPDMSHFFIGSNWPKMQGGVPNTYAFEPSTSEATWYLDYRPRRP